MDSALRRTSGFPPSIALERSYRSTIGALATDRPLEVLEALERAARELGAETWVSAVPARPLAQALGRLKRERPVA